MRQSRKRALAGFGSAVASMAMAGNSFACIAYTGEGRIGVPGNGTISTAIGDDGKSELSYFHDWCSMSAGAQAPSEGHIVVAVSGHVNTGADDPCPTNQLPASGDPYTDHLGRTKYTGIGPYNVTFTNVGFAYRLDEAGGGEGEMGWEQMNYACDDGPDDDLEALQGQDNTPANTTIGTMFVDDNGFGYWSGNLPSAAVNAPGEQAAICVWARQQPGTLDELPWVLGEANPYYPFYDPRWDYRGIMIPVEIVML